MPKENYINNVSVRTTRTHNNNNIINIFAVRKTIVWILIENHTTRFSEIEKKIENRFQSNSS